MDNTYRRRQGIDWQNDLYLKLLKFIEARKLTTVINKGTYNSISSEQLRNLSTQIFPKYGHRKAYQEKVRFFLECHYESIEEDLSSTLLF